MLSKLLAIPLFFMLLLGFGKVSFADNVAMVETMKFLSPATVNLLVQRANNGGPFGFQVGDEITYIIKYKPVPNGGNTGANGYITDYMPEGLQVIGAGFLQPDGFGGYFEVPPLPGGDMPNTPLGNGNRFAVSLSPLLPATAVNISAEAVAGGITPPLNQGTLAQQNGDTGVWYSTDIRTAFNAVGAAAASRNVWDLDQVQYEFICAQNNGGAEGPWGTGSPVAGPESFYQFEVNWAVLPCLQGPVGPWHRIAVPGSHIGDYGLLGDIQASRELFPGDPLYGRDVALSPLSVVTPTAPVTLRWANGLNSVGEVKYVFVKARIAYLPPGGTIINHSEVWGGDVFYGEGGKDNPWKYNDTLVSISNNSDMVIIKTPNVEVAQIGDVVSFQITIINTGARPHTNVVVTDYVNTSYDVGNIPPVYEIMVTYNNDASAGGIYTAGAPGIVAGSENITWNLPLLNPGQSQTFTYSVTALTPPNVKVTSAADHVNVTSTEMPAPGAAAGASFEIGTFPLVTQSKAVLPSAVLPGATVRYHIQLANAGAGYAGVWADTAVIPSETYAPTDINNIVAVPTIIKDTLPIGFSYAGNAAISINGAPIPALNVTTTVLGSDVTWRIGHGVPGIANGGINGLPPGGTLDIYFDVLVSAGVAAGVYTNNVYTTMPYNKKPGKNIPPKGKDWGSIPRYSINTAPVTVGAVQMSKVATPNAVENSATGATTSYSITVTNNGAIAATGIVVTDTLPAGFSYQASSTTGTALLGEPTITGQNVVWPAFDLPANSSATVVFTANIASTVLPAAYYNNVSATAGNASIPDLLKAAPVVVSSPGLTVSKSVDKSTVVWRGDGITAAPFPSEILTYTITATNTGTASAIVSFADLLPAGFEYNPAVLGNVEVVKLSVAGIVTTLARTTDYLTFPTLLTVTPNWGTFTIPPKVGADNSVLTITFPVTAYMADSAPLANVVSATGTYNNTVSVAGNVLLPSFSGAGVSFVRPANKWTNTPDTAINGIIDYRLQVQNKDIYAWSGVSVVDYLGTLTTAGAAALTPSTVTYGAGNAAYYAIGLASPTGVPGVDPLWLLTTPTLLAPNITFDNAALGFSIPVGESLFIAYTATAPVTVPAVPTVHNSIQTLNYTSNALAHIITNVWDGALLANNAEDVLITATPNVNVTGTKVAAPASLYLYGAAAPNAVTYTITLTNPDTITTATGITITDTLPPGFSFGAGDTLTLSINGGAAIAIVPAYTAPALLTGSGTLSIPLAANAIPPLGTATIVFTSSVATLTAANTYYNSATWLGTNVNAGSIAPSAPVTIDPVSVTKKALTSTAIAGALATYRITVNNAGSAVLNNFSLTDYFGDAVGVLPSGFTYNSDIALSLNGTTLLAGTDYTAPVAASATPIWTLTTPITAGTVSAVSQLVVDFYANVPAAQVAGVYHNSVSSMIFTPDALPLVTALNPFNGANVSITADDVTVASVGISKAVVSPYASVVNDPVLGTLTKYSITVSNTSAAAQLVDITDTLPTGFTYRPGSLLINGVAAVDPVVNLQTLTWAALNAIVGVTTLEFTVDIANTVAAGVYNNKADLRLNAVPTVVIGNVNNVAVTVVAPEPYISKSTSTINIGKDIYGEYSLAHYQVKITNVGTADATGVVIADTLPLNFNIYGQPVLAINGVAVSAAAFSFAQVGQILTFDTIPAGGFTIPAAAAGVNGVITVDYDTSILNTVLAGPHSNLVHATTLNAGRLPLLAANDPFATVTLHDVGLSKTASITSLNPGDTTTYTITLTNSDLLLNLTTVVVTDYLPTGFTYVAPTTGTGWVPAEPNLVSGAGLPVWTIPTIPANSSATITFTAQVATTVSGGTTYYNSVLANHTVGAAIISFPNIGPTAPVTVLSALPSLTVVKSADVTSAAPGAVITYKVHVKNTGTGTATSVIAVDHMSSYSQLGLDAWGVNLPVQFTDGASLLPALSPSGVTLGAVEFSTDGGANYTPLNAVSRGSLTVDAYGYAPAITDFRVNLTGTMNTNTTTNPAFTLEYKAQVK